MGLILGTVQLGLDYGISNDAGRPLESEVDQILSYALDSGVLFFDTAPTYGNSERLVGSRVSDGKKIITKVPPRDSNPLTVRETLDESLDRLQSKAIYALLFHSAADVIGRDITGSYEQALAAKSEGQIEKVGVSVYSPEEAWQVLESHDIDLIQLPYNIIDQRVECSGLLAELAKTDIEVHSRSAFLQGTLLMPPDQLPAHFDSVKPLLKNLWEYHSKHDMSPLDAALAFVKRNPSIHHHVVGVNHQAELEEIMTSFRKKQRPDLDWSAFSVKEECIINPSMWCL